MMGCARDGMCVCPPAAGQCLSYANQADLLHFCKEESLVLIADEVYQVGGFRGWEGGLHGCIRGRAKHGWEGCHQP